MRFRCVKGCPACTFPGNGARRYVQVRSKTLGGKAQRERGKEEEGAVYVFLGINQPAALMFLMSIISLFSIGACLRYDFTVSTIRIMSTAAHVRGIIGKISDQLSLCPGSQIVSVRVHHCYGHTNHQSARTHAWNFTRMKSHGQTAFSTQPDAHTSLHGPPYTPSSLPPFPSPFPPAYVRHRRLLTPFAVLKICDVYS